MTAEQIEFARTHGVTKCPPSPAFSFTWRYQVANKRSEEASEDDLLRSAEMLRRVPTPRFFPNRTQVRRPR